MLILTKQERLVLAFLCLASLLGVVAHIFLKRPPDFRTINAAGQNQSARE